MAESFFKLEDLAAENEYSEGQTPAKRHISLSESEITLRDNSSSKKHHFLKYKKDLS